MKTKNMSENFDLKELYMAEIEPLMKQVHEKCMKHRLPYVAGFCYANDNERLTVHTMAGFFGIERTPFSMVMADKCLSGPESNPLLGFMALVGKAGEEPESEASVE